MAAGKPRFIPPAVLKRIRDGRQRNAAARSAVALAVDERTDYQVVAASPIAAPLPPPLVLDAPSIIRAPQLHGVAKCRWCQKPFRRMDERHWICSSDDCADRQLAAAMRKAGQSSGPILFLPLPLQIDVDESKVTHLLIAGAAGVSKSVGARWNLYRRCRLIPGYRALLLRCTYPELEKNHLQFCSAEAKALGDATYKNRIVTFEHGDDEALEAKIFSGYCDVASDIGQHMGPEWDECDLDEAVLFLPDAVNQITSRARGSGTARLAHERLGLSAGRTRLWSNPGGRAMRYLVAAYIKRKLDPDLYPKYDPSEYGVISCTLEDNPYEPEDYEKKSLSGLSAARYEQLRWGRWDIYAGTFFESWDSAIHLTHAEPA
jgi:hypothetical protein